MKRFVRPLLSISAPLLIFVAFIGFFARDSSEKLKPLPAFVVGAGLVISSALVRRQRRQRLLFAIKKKNDD
mgnify:CR=1 FL=1